MQSRTVKHRTGKSQAETEREEKLISQVSPLLRSGLLAYPSLQRPVIWAGLLGLSRNRKVYMTHCRQHGTDPEDVIWLPGLQTSSSYLTSQPGPGEELLLGDDLPRPLPAHVDQLEAAEPGEAGADRPPEVAGRHLPGGLLARPPVRLELRAASQ